MTVDNSNDYESPAQRRDESACESIAGDRDSQTYPSAVSTYLELYKEFDRAQDLDESQRDDFEWDVFSRWANRRGYCRSEADCDFGIGTEQGHEHYVKLLPDSNAYLKRTKWNVSGYGYDPVSGQVERSYVSEYLFRLAWQDFFFGTETKILGVVYRNADRAILSIQKTVEGDVPSPSFLHEFMMQDGYVWINNAQLNHNESGGKLYLWEGMFYVGDVRSDNCRVVDCGDSRKCVIPIDVFISASNCEIRGIMTAMMKDREII